MISAIKIYLKDGLLICKWKLSYCILNAVVQHFLYWAAMNTFYFIKNQAESSFLHPRFSQQQDSFIVEPSFQFLSM